MVRCLLCGWKMQRRQTSDGSYLLCRNHKCKRFYIVRDYDPQREIVGELLPFLVNGRSVEVVKGLLKKHQHRSVLEDFMVVGNTKTPLKIADQVRQMPKDAPVEVPA